MWSYVKVMMWQKESTTNPRDQKLTSGVATAIKESLLSNDGFFHLKNRGIVLSAESVHYNNKEKIATIIFSDELSYGNIGWWTYIQNSLRT